MKIVTAVFLLYAEEDEALWELCVNAWYLTVTTQEYVTKKGVIAYPQLEGSQKDQRFGMTYTETNMYGSMRGIGTVVNAPGRTACSGRMEATSSPAKGHSPSSAAGGRNREGSRCGARAAGPSSSARPQPRAGPGRCHRNRLALPGGGASSWQPSLPPVRERGVVMGTTLTAPPGKRGVAMETTPGTHRGAGRLI